MKTSRGASLVLALACLAAVMFHQGLHGRLVLQIAYLLFPLAIIWFPEELGEYTGRLGPRNCIDEPSPPVLLAIVGWLLLLARASYLVLLMMAR